MEGGVREKAVCKWSHDSLQRHSGELVAQSECTLPRGGIGALEPLDDCVDCVLYMDRNGPCNSPRAGELVSRREGGPQSQAPMTGVDGICK